MTARTVLNVSRTSVTTFDSGILSVGDLTELALDLNLTSAIGGAADGNGNYLYGFQLSRLDAAGNLVSAGIPPFSFVGYGSPITGAYAAAYGAGINGWSFGDRIQIILANDPGCSLTFTLSIIGK
jgi:hypothetical protein